METLIWTGAAISLIGLGGLVYCIVTVMRARRAGLDDAAMKTKLQSVVAWNLGSLLTSALGLMMVVVGIILG